MKLNSYPRALLNESAGVLMELAISIVLILTLVGTTIDLGWTLRKRLELQDAVHNAARIVTYAIDEPALDASNVARCTTIAEWLDREWLPQVVSGYVGSLSPSRRPSEFDPIESCGIEGDEGGMTFLAFRLTLRRKSSSCIFCLASALGVIDPVEVTSVFPINNKCTLNDLGNCNGE